MATDKKKGADIPTDPDQAIAQALKELQKMDIPVSMLSPEEEGTIKKIDVVPTGSHTLNLALGVGGFPRGRIIEIYGEYSSGKSMIALSTVAQAQAMGGKAAYIDAEHAVDPAWAQKLGVNTKELYFLQPDSGEQALEAVAKFADTNAFSVIVVDSVAALVPQAELDADIEQQTIGLQARLISRALRKLTGKIHKSNTCVIFINQLRTKIGVMFGNPEDTPGGRALKFYASVRCEIKKLTGAENRFYNGDKDLIGHTVQVTCVKNKVAPPYRKAQFEVYYGKGIDHVSEIATVALKTGIVHVDGNTYMYKDKKIAVGEGKYVEAVRSNEKLQTVLLKRIQNQPESAVDTVTPLPSEVVEDAHTEPV